MSSSAARKLSLLRTVGRTQSHEDGYIQRASEKKDEDQDQDVDLEKLHKGIKFFSDNFFSMFVSMLTGLLSLMYIETIALVLEVTDKSNSAPLSFSRYLSTLNHTLAWYRDVPELLKSSARVRVLHRQAAKMRRFSQYEMVVTQWAFVGPALLWPSKLGISVNRETEEGLSGLVHVMYLVGRELGIREELNMCAGGLEEVRETARQILTAEIQPSFLADSAPGVCRELATHLLAGVKILNPFINPESFRKWSEKTIFEREKVDTDHLDSFTVTMYRLQLRVLSLFQTPVLGPGLRLVANKLMRLNIFLATDWEPQILQDQQKQRDGVSQPDKLLAVLQAVLTIPLMVFVSLGSIIKQNIIVHRSECLLGISTLVISVLIMNLL